MQTSKIQVDGVPHALVFERTARRRPDRVEWSTPRPDEVAAGDWISWFASDGASYSGRVVRIEARGRLLRVDRPAVETPERVELSTVSHVYRAPTPNPLDLL